MATGPDHYREAERLLAGRTFPADPELHIEERYVPPTADDIAAAQVHATLALAAATAMQAAVDGSEPGMGSREFEQWYQVAGVKPKRGGNA